LDEVSLLAPVQNGRAAPAFLPFVPHTLDHANHPEVTMRANVGELFLTESQAACLVTLRHGTSMPELVI